jgi:hypothetical protein
MNNTLLLVAAIISLVASAPSFSNSTSQIGANTLEGKISYDIDVVGAPDLVLENILRGTGIPGGVVTIEDCSGAPTLRVKSAEGTTVADTLGSLVVGNPKFKWETHDGVVNLLPTDQSAEILDVRITTRESDIPGNFAPSAVMSELFALPVVRQRAAELNLKEGLITLGPGVACETCEKKEDKPIRIAINGISLQEALNSVARTYGHTIWNYREHRCRGDKTYTIGTQAD